MLAGCVAADLAFAATSIFAQAREVHAATCGGDVRAHWHGGPFFEYRRAVGAPPVGAPVHFRVAPLRERDGRAEYRRRRDFLVAALNDMGLRTVLPKGAFYVFPDIRSTGLSS